MLKLDSHYYAAISKYGDRLNGDGEGTNTYLLIPAIWKAWLTRSSPSVRLIFETAS